MFPSFTVKLNRLICMWPIKNIDSAIQVTTKPNKTVKVSCFTP